MKQPSLFDNREPIAANLDPITSHIAADSITRSGVRGNQKRKVLDALERYPGRTSAELALAMAADRYMVAKRLPDLLHDGLVEQGAIRACRVSGRPAVTWRVKT